jgi:hypothetical protein
MSATLLTWHKPVALFADDPDGQALADFELAV